MSTPHADLPPDFLEASEPFWRLLIASAPLAIHAVDREGRVTLWNPAAEAIFGWRAAEVMGRPDPTPGGGGEPANPLLEEVMRGRRVVEREMPRRARDGSVRHVAISAAPLVDDRGRATGMMVMTSDIGDRRQDDARRDALLAREQTARVEAEAAVQRVRFLADGSALLDGSLDYATTLDNLARLAVPFLADYCLIDEIEGDYVSRVALAHVDPARERLLHREVRQPLTADLERHPTIRVMTTGTSVLVEEATDEILDRIAHDDAHLERLRALQLGSFVVVPLSARGRTLGAITLAYAESGRRYGPEDLEVAEELGRRAAMAVETARLYRESCRAVTARERLMAVVSHDLRNSLATVLLNASAIIESPAVTRLDGGTREQLQWIARSAEQMNRLISDLLDVSAIELGRLSVVPSRQQVRRIVHDAAAMYRPLMAERGIGFTWEGSWALPDVWVDPERLQQVLGNLLGNAIKFTPPGGSVALRAESGEAADAVRFLVSDSGPGIAAEEVPALFDPYWQGKRGRPRGSGLGLAIAKAIVEAHGGRIGVESSPGAGSVFAFTVPIVRSRSWDARENVDGE